MKKMDYSTEHILYLKRLRTKKTGVIVARFLVLFLLLALWEIGADIGLFNPFITSSPLRIVKTIGWLWSEGNLARHLAITLGETLIGFAIAVLLGYGIALLLWLNDSVKQVLEPFIVVLNALPKIALGPLIIIWMGTGYSAIIFMTVLVAIIVCIMNMLAGFYTVDGTMLTLVKSLGASKGLIVKKLIIPASLPTLMNTLKVAVGLAWIGSIMGEYIVSRAGLGYLIVYGGQVFRLDLVLASTVILCLLAGGMYGTIALLERKFCPKT